MGICIKAINPTAPVPRETVTILTCDGETGLFPPAQASFARIEDAMAAGWKETYGPTGEKRLFLCPDCSGKEPKS